eukprot:TRINITY_DN1418_c0_g1_i1.p1 TRINITY_DN1418_c0_g1~~TRINITY_DN1418_c0_g1_i1.p1  ORF type:complete len:200 (-),score=36.60 TRINITY_DN1418_c0_g1_i1:404-1003(-)
MQSFILPSARICRYQNTIICGKYARINSITSRTVQLQFSQYATTKSFEGYQFQINEALVKEYETHSLRSLKEQNIQALQGIGPKSEEAFNSLGVHTVQELANWKYWKMARAMLILSETCSGSRAVDSVMNIDWAVDKEYENKSLKEIVDSPLDAIQGLSERAKELLKILPVKTVRDLGELKYCKWAEAICELAEFEDYN